VPILRFAVAHDALLYLFVDLPQRHAAGAFQTSGIGVGIEMGIVCHARRLFLMGRLLILIRMRSRSKHAETGRGPARNQTGGQSAVGTLHDRPRQAQSS
jgi:hypothetical protein